MMAEQDPERPGYALDRRFGLRLRAFDPMRDAAVRSGIAAMLAALPSDSDPWELDDPADPTQRLRRSLARTIDSYDRCGRQAWAHIRRVVRSDDGEPGRWMWWAADECHARGHEACAPQHAAAELNRHRLSLDQVYGGPVRVIQLSAPGWGLVATRRAVERLLASAPVRTAVGMVIGYLLAAGGREPGYSVGLVLPGRVRGPQLGTLLREWRRRVPCGWMAEVLDLPGQPSAMEALVELRTRSEQALPRLVAEGEISAEQGLEWLAVEIGAAAGRALGRGPQRLVMSPGMRTFDRSPAVAVLAAAGGEAGGQAAEYDGTDGPGADSASSSSKPSEAHEGPATGSAQGSKGDGAEAGDGAAPGPMACPPGDAYAVDPGVGVEEPTAAPRRDTPAPAPDDDRGSHGTAKERGSDPSMDERRRVGAHTRGEELAPGIYAVKPARRITWWQAEALLAKGGWQRVIIDGRQVGWVQWDGLSAGTRGNRR